MVIEQIHALELHDGGLESLQLNFSTKEVRIGVSVFIDKESEYDLIELIFTGVTTVNLNEIIVKNFLSLEVLTHEVEAIEEGYKIEFLFFQGSGSPRVRCSFDFSECTIKRSRMQE